MSVDTKGLVMTQVKDAFIIAEIIEESLRNLIKESFPKVKFLSNIYTKLITNSKGLSFEFKFGEEQRVMFCWLDVDCDGTDCGYLDGSKIILSLGYWGSSVLIMETILEGLSNIGETYIMENDSNGNLRKIV